VNSTYSHEAHFAALEGGPDQGQGHGFVVDLHFHAVGLAQNVVHIGRDHVDDPQLQRFLLRDRNALAYRLLRPLDVPAPFLGDRTAQGHGEILHFLAHVAADGFPLAADRMCGPDVGSGRHGGDVGRHGDEDTGRNRSGAARGDINDHGQGRTEEVLDDGLGRVEKASGRVQLNEQGAGFRTMRHLDRFAQEIGRCRVDPGVDDDQMHGCRRRPGRGRFRGRRGWLLANGGDADENGEQEQDGGAAAMSTPGRHVGSCSSAITILMSSQTRRLSAGLRSR
jgi:hypothetical protein